MFFDVVIFRSFRVFFFSKNEMYTVMKRQKTIRTIIQKRRRRNETNARFIHCHTNSMEKWLDICFSRVIFSVVVVFFNISANVIDEMSNNVCSIEINRWKGMSVSLFKTRLIEKKRSSVALNNEKEGKREKTTLKDNKRFFRVLFQDWDENSWDFSVKSSMNRYRSFWHTEIHR